MRGDSASANAGEKVAVDSARPAQTSGTLGLWEPQITPDICLALRLSQLAASFTMLWPCALDVIPP